MIEREVYYFENYPRMKDVSQDTCDMAACCSTCMYRTNDQNFEHDYCVNPTEVQKFRTAPSKNA